MVEIKHRFTDAILCKGECTVRVLAEKNKADLSGANLSGADLFRADLFRANLSGAKGISPNRCTQLLILHEQVGKIRAYKLVNEKYEGPFYGGIKYTVGKTYVVDDADCSIEIQCSKGISLASLDWCMKEWKPGYHILVAEFARKDIAAIPTATDGKFRVKKCKIIKEKDLLKLGLEAR